MLAPYRKWLVANRRAVAHRTTKALRDLFQKRRRGWIRAPVTFVKKVAARDIQLAATCNDVAKKMPNFDFAVRIKNNAEPECMGPASRWQG